MLSSNALHTESGCCAVLACLLPADSPHAFAMDQWFKRLCLSGRTLSKQLTCSRQHESVLLVATGGMLNASALHSPSALLDAASSAVAAAEARLDHAWLQLPPGKFV